MSDIWDAALNGDVERVREWLRQDPELLNRRTGGSIGWTPCYRAACGGYVDTLNRLIEAGADVDKANRYGTTPLMIAARNGKSDSVPAILKAMGALPSRIVKP